MRTVILGLGNSILRDDAVGLEVVRTARALLSPGEPVDVAENERGGMDVVDAVSGYDRAVIVDAIKTGARPPGAIRVLEPRDLPPTRRLAGLHDLDLPTALELAGRTGQRVPEHIVIVTVEIEDDLTFGDRMTERVEAAVPEAARAAVTLARGRSWPDDRAASGRPTAGPAGSGPTRSST